MIKAIMGIIRAPFLLLAPACVSVGVASAYRETGTIHWIQVVMVLIGAVSAHACVNAFNEYFDFKSGLDAKTDKTPFSGGSGTLPAQPQLVKLAWWYRSSRFSRPLPWGFISSISGDGYFFRSGLSAFFCWLPIPYGLPKTRFCVSLRRDWALGCSWSMGPILRWQDRIPLPRSSPRWSPLFW